MAIADSFGSNYINNIAKVSQAFAPINSNVLNQALAPGGSMSGSLGFGGGGIDVTGLSPEDIAGLVNMRGAIQKQNSGLISDTTSLADIISGNKETREAMQTANRDLFNIEGQGALQERSLTNSREMQREQQLFSAGENKLTREQAAKEHEMKLQEEKRYHDLYFKDQDADRAQRGSQFSETMKLKREEMVAVKQAAESSLATKDTTDLIAKLGELKNKAADNKLRDDYFNYHMMEASLTSPIGSVYNLNDYNDIPAVKGYKQVMLAKDGNWYGINRDKSGTIVGASATPIVYNPINAVKAAKSGGSSTKLEKKYQSK